MLSVEFEFVFREEKKVLVLAVIACSPTLDLCILIIVYPYHIESLATPSQAFLHFAVSFFAYISFF